MDRVVLARLGGRPLSGRPLSGRPPHGRPPHVASAAALGVSVVLLLTACHGPADPPRIRSVPITGPDGVEMVLLPGGTFEMGQEGGAADEAPPHRVRIRPFVIDRDEVTQARMARLALPDPSKHKGPTRPVHQVRWSDAVEFCNLRSAEEGLVPCYDEVTFACDFDATGYRLPTEAEWEFAARGGASSLRDGIRGAVLAERSGGRPAPVDRLRGDTWGIRGLHGNVSEWCHDVYGEDYYSKSPAEDPVGPEKGPHRVLRGASYLTKAEDARATRRYHDTPGTTDACFAKPTYGFRCVRRPTSEEMEELAKLDG